MTDLNDIVSTTIRARAEQMAKNIQTNALVHRLIDNLPPPKPLTPLERLQRKLADYEYRIVGAWKVLTGQAEIYDGQDD